MVVLPYQVSATEYEVFIAFDDEGLERLKAYDSAYLDWQLQFPAFARMTLKGVSVGYYTQADQDEVAKMLVAGRLKDALKFLSRGFEVKPGDHDGSGLSLIHDTDVRT